MCKMCEHTICTPGCPNYAPNVVYICGKCAGDIIVGDTFAEIDDSCYHFECIADMPNDELLDLCKITFEVAEIATDERNKCNENY